MTPAPGTAAERVRGSAAIRFDAEQNRRRSCSARSASERRRRAAHRRARGGAPTCTWRAMKAKSESRRGTLSSLATFAASSSRRSGGRHRRGRSSPLAYSALARGAAEARRFEANTRPSRAEDKIAAREDRLHPCPYRVSTAAKLEWSRPQRCAASCSMEIPQAARGQQGAPLRTVQRRGPPGPPCRSCSAGRGERVTSARRSSSIQRSADEVAEEQPPTSASYTLDDAFAGADALSHAFSCRRGATRRLSMSTTMKTSRRCASRLLAASSHGGRRSRERGRRHRRRPVSIRARWVERERGHEADRELRPDDPSARMRRTPRARASPTISQDPPAAGGDGAPFSSGTRAGGCERICSEASYGLRMHRAPTRPNSRRPSARATSTRCWKPPATINAGTRFSPRIARARTCASCQPCPLPTSLARRPLSEQ